MSKLKFIVSLIAFLAGYAGVWGQEYEWETAMMDGSRTGCVSLSKDNIPQALGTFKGRKYIAPDGTVYGPKSIVTKTARTVMDAQPAMARVKDVVGYSTVAMTAEYPESPLSNWFIDLLMRKTEELSGKTVHMGITNFGGIRIDMPEGEIILDDMLSMFPFKNQLAYVQLTGKQIRTILENMAQRRFEVLGGVKVVAEDRKRIGIIINTRNQTAGITLRICNCTGEEVILNNHTHHGANQTTSLILTRSNVCIGEVVAD